MDHNYTNDKNYCNVKDHCHDTGKCRGASQNMYNLRYSIPKEISVVFHNGSNFDYHYIIKDLAKMFERNLIVSEKIPKNIKPFQFQ